jgi:hypothetical protein
MAAVTASEGPHAISVDSRPRTLALSQSATEAKPVATHSAFGVAAGPATR